MIDAKNIYNILIPPIKFKVLGGYKIPANAISSLIHFRSRNSSFISIN
jgi:hypothetical protein